MSVERLIQTKNLAKHLKQAKEENLLEEEFRALPSGGTAPYKIGRKKGHSKKNRFKNVIPCKFKTVLDLYKIINI